MNKIIITAGHHNADSGAVANGFKESEEAIKDRNELVKAVHFISPSTQVIIDDDNDNLATVIRKINAVGTPKDLLLDIHYNSASVIATGVEAFINGKDDPENRRIAGRLVELSSKMLNIPNRGVKLESSSQHPRLGILHTVVRRSILLERGFINNPGDMKSIEKLRWEWALGTANILIQELTKLR
ncbi:MAG TPA: N-acetylmuramoyl-L-alanine amidase [Candidatus Sphingobacterium stercoripullorum]|uniref:N-acetylmuramoyl-L-alanine amidase n=1 Tax=Candidatus Sphingobacterium stercoripullorum TaxID=2838759 RepID=A0A9D1W972_9SPHI|nr:N-acetylmuramoyl-L-alanine amidase [Candidatus Sphingobacterium stercoripullorum]